MNFKKGDKIVSIKGAPLFKRGVVFEVISTIYEYVELKGLRGWHDMKYFRPLCECSGLVQNQHLKSFLQTHNF